MKSRPILFSGPMVRALLDGSKTQTRRILKGSTEFKGSYNPDYLHVHKNAPGWSDICPYGKPGDQLWVRETWGARFSHADFGGVALHWNDLRGPLKKYRTHQNLALYAMSANGQYCGGWIPSIHMPRWASRITLEITGVRVERLHEISDADAMAEGMESYALNGKPSVTGKLNLPSEYYRYLWESINGPGSWDANPWVWVIEFRRLS